MRTGLLILLLLAFTVAPVAAGEDPRIPIQPTGVELAPNPSLEEGAGDRPAGWGQYRAPGAMTVEWGDFGIGGSKGLKFTGPKGGTSKHAGISHAHEAPEAGRTITLTAWVRLTDFKGMLIVWARCDGEKGPQRHPEAFQNSTLAGYRPSGSSIWSPITVRVTPNEETKRVMFGVLAAGAGMIQVDEVHATVTAEAKTGRTSLGPGIYRAEGRYVVMATEDTAEFRVHFPVPILWRDQIPLDFNVRTEPAGHAKVTRLLRTAQGFHIAEVTLTKVPKGRSLKFAWDGRVLVLPHRPTAIPADVSVPVKKVPKEIAAWLEPTWCCNTEDAALKKVAAEIAAAGKTADVIVPKTLEKMKEIFRSAKGHVRDLTASEALTRRGSCTSCANLGAALLRANGIPARIIAGYPTWSGPLQTHYVVEYWLPDGGWRLMESTMCRDDRPGWEQIEVAMVLPADEVKEKAGRRAGAAGGVPFRSLTEYPDAKGLATMVRLIGDMPDKKYCDHNASMLSLLTGTEEDWAKATRHFSGRWRSLTDAVVKDPAAAQKLAAVLDSESETMLTKLREGQKRK